MKNSKRFGLYVTTFCNFAHDLSDGVPINHGCYVIPPNALIAEMEQGADSNNPAWQAFYKSNRREHRGRKEEKQNVPFSKFKLEINLDDESEVENFIKKYGHRSTGSGRWIANALGLKGRKSTLLAERLRGYAWNKYTAMGLRKEGKIATALQYEQICDDIYKRITPLCECW